MMLHNVLPTLIDGKAIRQASVPTLQYIIAINGDDARVLVMYEPQGGLLPTKTTFGLDDILADDWEVV